MLLSNIFSVFESLSKVNLEVAAFLISDYLIVVGILSMSTSSGSLMNLICTLMSLWSVMSESSVMAVRPCILVKT